MRLLMIEAIHLYLEGMFWKAYQWLAFLFVQHVVPINKIHR
jgi:hypothetical protein